MKQRELKVHTHIYESRFLKYGVKQYKLVPKLVLCGNWLKDAGINPGEHVKITFANGSIIISP